MKYMGLRSDIGSHWKAVASVMHDWFLFVFESMPDPKQVLGAAQSEQTALVS